VDRVDFRNRILRHINRLGYIRQTITHPFVNKTGYFGAARHTCLGKAVSIEAWRTATSTLGRINKSVRIGEIRYRRSDFVFNTPAAVEVVISDD
jgi:hypothetical protein